MVSLEDVYGAGAAAARYRVDEDQRIPAFKQVVGQVHPPDAVVDDLHARIVLLDWDVPDYLGAEAVVAEEDIADAGHQDAHWNRTLHVPDLEVPPGVWQGYQPHHDSGQREQPQEADEHPSYDFHVEFLSVVVVSSGSSSSGEKYR